MPEAGDGTITQRRTDVRAALHESWRVQAGFSTPSVLLPESLRVCPFGGAAWPDTRGLALSPDACGECTRA
jgi:hypothetical protein